MKTLRLLAFASFLASSALAQTSGFYVNAGGGMATLKTGGFTQTTSYGEIIKNKDAKDSVAGARIEIGYQFDENWDLGVQFTDYATAEIQMEYPKYPGIFSIVPMPAYSRHVLLYDTIRFALVPSYTFAAGDRMRLRASAGVVGSRTRSHFEATYYIQYSGRPNETLSERYPEEKNTSLSYVASVSAEWIFTKHLSLALNGGYSPYKMDLPASRIAPFGPTQPSTGSLKVEAFEAFVTFIYRK